MELVPCPLCGAAASGPDWSAVTECYGHNWQSCTIRCSAGNRSPYCDHEVSLNTDEFNAAKAPLLEALLGQCWNDMAKILTAPENA